MPAIAVSRSRRRLLRFGVRWLIVLVLVIGAGLGWIVRSARIQREAVEAIQHAGGVAWYNWEWKDGHASGGEPFAPKWLVNRIGVDYFGHVVAVFNAEPDSDKLLLHLGHLSQLETLWLRGPFVTETGLAPERANQTLTARPPSDKSYRRGSDASEGAEGTFLPAHYGRARD